MYVLKNKKIAFIGHPRTGSTAIGHVLTEHLGFERVGTYHGIVPEIIEPDWIVGCTVRNVYDTIVSWYFYNRHPGPFEDWLPDFLDNPNHLIKDGLFYGQKYATHVLRFENLDADFQEFLLKAGLDDHPLPKKNVSERRAGRPWRTFFTPRLMTFVKNHSFTKDLF